MRITAIALLAALALATGACQNSEDHPKAAAATAHTAALTDCSARWTLAAKIGLDQAAQSCQGADGKAYVPKVLACDPALHHGVAVQLVLGPDGRYAVFVAPARTSEVDDGHGTGDYRDDQDAAHQELACGAA